MVVIKEIIPKPGTVEEFDTPAGRIQIIGGQNKFARRETFAAPNTPDIIFGVGETFTIHQGDVDIVIRPFTPEKAEASPILDGAV